MTHPPYGRGDFPYRPPYVTPPTNPPLPKPAWYQRKRVILPLGALVLLMAGGILLGGDPTPESGFTAGATPSKSAAPVKSAPAAPKVLTVKADVFAAEFDANQVAAEAKYKGKVVRTTAKISNINDGRVSLNPFPPDVFSLTQISCNDVPDAQVLKLKKGTEVTITGKVTGQTIGVIDFQDCTVS